MLGDLIRALRRTNVIPEMFGQVVEMLEIGQWMFSQASEVLMRETDWHAVADELYAKDRQINKIEQRLRERIVMHLAAGSKADLSACLMLMSVVKDAERIGDYCKNIFEVGKFYEREYAHPEYAGPLQQIRDSVTPLFQQAEKAFMKEDGALASKVMTEGAKLRQKCDLIIQQLLTAQGKIPSDEAVAYVLLSRFYKRVSAHLANIATSVISPVPMLDYLDERSN